MGTQRKMISQCVLVVSECSWPGTAGTLEGRISVGSLDRVQGCPVPSIAKGLVLLGFAKLAGAGQGQRAGSTFLRFGREGQDRRPGCCLPCFPAPQGMAGRV